jgi:hypothetical protein
LETWAGGEKEWRWACVKRKEGEKRSGPVRSFGPRWAEMREGEGEGLDGEEFFFKPFQTPCIQIMMHKHLLLLNY